MPPKPKFSKEEIISTALKIVSENGIESLTARELGIKLGSSARPIFTLFSGMEQLQKEVRLAAMMRFENMQLDEVSQKMPLFKQIGIKMVQFGIKEPKLYQMLFMQENRNAKTFEDILESLGSTATECVETIQAEYGLSPNQAKTLFEHTWIHTFGIGALCATKTCDFSLEKISQMLTQDFTAMLNMLKFDSA